jgi:hypothetical protein
MRDGAQACAGREMNADEMAAMRAELRDVRTERHRLRIQLNEAAAFLDGMAAKFEAQPLGSWLA